jgi:hypothetical protein
MVYAYLVEFTHPTGVSGSFDGGCRTTVPVRPSSPGTAHDALIVQLALLSRVYRGGF